MDNNIENNGIDSSTVPKINEDNNPTINNNDAMAIPMAEETELFINDYNEDEDEDYMLQDNEPRYKKKESKKKYIIIISGIIIIIIVLIGIIKKMLTKEVISNKPRISMNDIYYGKFSPQYNEIQWVDNGVDGSLIQIGQTGDIELYNVVTNEITKIATVEDLSKKNKINQGFLISKSLKFILITTSVKSVFRHSKLKDYLIFDCEKKKYLDFDELKDISNIEWSPAGNKLAYIKENNLYFLDLDIGTSIQVTNDGSKNIFNGISDWVYEEEILMESQAFWWSPNSKYIAFLKFNDTNVPEYVVPVYLDDNSESIPYNGNKTIKYPKPGFSNPEVSVHIFDTTAQPKGKLRDIAFEKDYGFESSNLVILQMLWATEESESLLIRTSNRVQDIARLFVLYADKEINSKEDYMIATFLKEDDFDDDNGWLTRLDSLYFAPPKSYIDIMEDKKGYQHIAFYNELESEKFVFLTSGEWEVSDIVGIDKDKELIYYIGTEEGSMQRHLYSVNYKGKRNIKMTPIINDTNIDKEDEINEFGENLSEIGMYSASFSTGFNFYVLTYSGPKVPWQTLLCTTKDYDEFHIDISTNENLISTLEKYNLPKLERFTIPIDDYEVNALAIYPPEFSKSKSKKYPVLFNPYGGPNSQMADYSYQYGFDSVLASNKDYPFIVIKVDGRGTGWRGREFRVGIAKQLGKLEAEDQIKAAKYIQTLPYVDSEKISIWGWSYGGYLTSKVVEANSGVFKVAMAVAPVIDWRLYDSMYTERYMKTLDENQEGYITSSVKNMTGFNNVDFLLVHGTEDDNVHFQNSALLVSKLTYYSVKNYVVQFYTDNDHSMRFGNAYSQLMDLLTKFLIEKIYS